MKSLYESLLDDFDTINSKIDPKEDIKQFLKDNYVGKYLISNKPNKDGLYEVSSLGDIKIKNKNITFLTNNLFVWGKVGGTFACFRCHSLTSLKGAPEKVGGGFLCYDCYSLTSLEGAPKYVGGSFYCYGCGKTFLKSDVEKVCNVNKNNIYVG